MINIHQSTDVSSCTSCHADDALWDVTVGPCDGTELAALQLCDDCAGVLAEGLAPDWTAAGPQQAGPEQDTLTVGVTSYELGLWFTTTDGTLHRLDHPDGPPDIPDRDRTLCIALLNLARRRIIEPPY